MPAQACRRRSATFAGSGIGFRRTSAVDALVSSARAACTASVLHITSTSTSTCAEELPAGHISPTFARQDAGRWVGRAA
jgi:hypothetical protein